MIDRCFRQLFDSYHRGPPKDRQMRIVFSVRHREPGNVDILPDEQSYQADLARQPNTMLRVINSFQVGKIQAYLIEVMR